MVPGGAGILFFSIQLLVGRFSFFRGVFLRAWLLQRKFSLLRLSHWRGVFSFSRLTSRRGVFFFQGSALGRFSHWRGHSLFHGSAPAEGILFFKTEILDGVFFIFFWSQLLEGLFSFLRLNS